MNENLWIRTLRTETLLLSTVVAWEERSMIQSPTPSDESLPIQINDTKRTLRRNVGLQ